MNNSNIKQDIGSIITGYKINGLPGKEADAISISEYIIKHGTAKNNADFALFAYYTNINMFDHCKVISTGTKLENLDFVWNCYRKFIDDNEHIEETFDFSSISGSLMKFVCCNFPNSYKWGPIYGADYDKLRITEIDILVHCLAVSALKHDYLRQEIIDHYAKAVNNNYFFHLNHNISISLTRYLAGNHL